jgi:hypothetical protein
MTSWLILVFVTLQSTVAYISYSLLMYIFPFFLYLHSSIRLHGVVINYLSARETFTSTFTLWFRDSDSFFILSGLCKASERTKEGRRNADTHKWPRWHSEDLASLFIDIVDVLRRGVDLEGHSLKRYGMTMKGSTTRSLTVAFLKYCPNTEGI